MEEKHSSSFIGMYAAYGAKMFAPFLPRAEYLFDILRLQQLFSPLLIQLREQKNWGKFEVFQFLFTQTKCYSVLFTPHST